MKIRSISTSFRLRKLCKDSYLRFLAKVGGEFKTSDVAPVISNYDDRMDGVELDASRLCLFCHHCLLANGLIFVDSEVKNMNLRIKQQTVFIMSIKSF